MKIMGWIEDFQGMSEGWRYGWCSICMCVINGESSHFVFLLFLVPSHGTKLEDGPT